MSNTLVKRRTLIDFVPETGYDPGHPGTPATPERVTFEVRPTRFEISASQMRRIAVSVWRTPLDDLRALLNEPNLSASAAHYSDTWAVLVNDILKERVPVAWTSAWVTRNVMVKVVVPAQPAVPPRAPRPAQPARSVYDYHFGWNAGAQSQRVLPSGWVGTATFRITKPVGAVVGFARESSVPTGRRTTFSNIGYGVVVADGQIRLREGGITTGKVLATATGNDTVTATVNGRSIEWRVNGTLAHQGPFVMPQPFVLDAALYAGGDAVNDPALTDGVESEADTGNLVLPPIGLQAEASEAWVVDMRMRPVAMLASDYEVCQGALSMRPLRIAPGESARCTLTLRSARVSAADAANNSVGNLSAAALRGQGEVQGGDGAYIPTYSIATLGMLPVVMTGNVLGGQSMDVQATMQPLGLMASQDAYGESRLALRAMDLKVDAEAVTPLVRALNMQMAESTIQPRGHVALVISEQMGVVGGLSLAAVTVTADMLEAVSAESTAEALAHIVAAMMEQIGAADKTTALLFRPGGGVVVGDEEGDAWVVNADSDATARYEKYSFNSFAAVRGRHFGSTRRGVYLLSGDTDDGQAIASGVALGKHNFGGMELKHLDAVYVGVSATGQMLLKVSDGTREFTYAARRVDDHLRTQRFDPGKGLRASYFEFDLLNEEGLFELDSITFSVIATKRRI